MSYIEEHPCLCDICLAARDAEIARVRASQKQKVLELVRGIVPYYCEDCNGECVNKADLETQIENL